MIRTRRDYLKLSAAATGSAKANPPAITAKLAKIRS